MRDLLPRIKRINKTRLYRPSAGDPGAWPRLEPALTRPIRWDLVASQYDQMIKYATAIRTGIATAEAILRRFTKANAVHPAYQAMAEVGRAQRTIFIALMWNLESRQVVPRLSFWALPGVTGQVSGKPGRPSGAPRY